MRFGGGAYAMTLAVVMTYIDGWAVLGAWGSMGFSFGLLALFIGDAMATDPKVK